MRHVGHQSLTLARWKHCLSFTAHAVAAVRVLLLADLTPLLRRGRRPAGRAYDPVSTASRGQSGRAGALPLYLRLPCAVPPLLLLFPSFPGGAPSPAPP
jgi:hypothetical protein